MEISIDKYKNDPNWSEIIKLYSGLFRDKENRQNFIIEIAESNVLLAAECKNSSTDSEEDLILALKRKSIEKLNISSQQSAISESILSLVRLGDSAHLENYLSKINIPRSCHKEIISKSIDDLSDSSKFRLLEIFLDNKKQTQMTLWLSEILASEINFTISKNDIKPIISNLLNVRHAGTYRLSDKLITQYCLQKEFNNHDIIKKLMSDGNKKNLKLAFGRVSKYNLWGNYPKNLFIQKAIESNAFKLAINWIVKNNIIDEQLIDSLINKIESTKTNKSGVLLKRIINQILIKQTE